MGRYFNIDLHVSVIEDVAKQFHALGHKVVSHNMSGHMWALQRHRASKGTGPGPEGRVGYGNVNLTTWEGLFNDPPAYEKVAAWQKEHPELNDFDGYIVTYPPSFALLYEQLRGKIILDIAIRYELHFTERPDAWRDFNERLHKLHEAGRLVAVANSQYDAHYYSYFTGLPCRHISSTCNYIDRLSPKWEPRGPKFLAFGEHAGCREAAKQVPSVLFVRDALSQYKHAEIVMARGIVWIPYNVNAMSFFEQYWLNIPLFVPTKRFLLEMYEQKLAITQLSWHNNNLGGSNLPRVATELPDPNTPEGLRAWMGLYDFYNEAEYPYVTYFDSWDDLRRLTVETDFVGVSAKMKAWNVERRLQNLKRWQSVING